MSLTNQYVTLGQRIDRVLSEFNKTTPADYQPGPSELSESGDLNEWRPGQTQLQPEDFE